MKKLLLSLGSVAAAIAPVTAVIACSPGDKSEESPDKIAQSLGLKLGKQAADGVVLTIKEDKTNKIAAEKYYLKKEQLAKGSTFEVKSTESTGLDDFKKITLKVVTAITVADDIGASLETVPATGEGKALAATNVKGVAGDATKFTGTFENVTRPFADTASVTEIIATSLEKKQPKELFENSYTNKANLEEAINKVLESIDKKLGEDAITLVKPKITSIDNKKLDTEVVKADQKFNTLDLTFGKQDVNKGFVLTVPENTTKKIAGEKYYLKKEQLAKGSTFEVFSTEKGKKITLKVKEAIKADADTGNLSIAIETNDETPADIDNVTAAKSTAATFFAKQDEVTTVVTEETALTKIQDVLNKALKTNNLTKPDVTKTINQLLIPFGKKLKDDGSSLGYTGPQIKIDDNLVDVEK